MLANDDLSEATANPNVRVNDRIRADSDVADEDGVRTDFRKRRDLSLLRDDGGRVNLQSTAIPFLSVSALIHQSVAASKSQVMHNRC